MHILVSNIYESARRTNWRGFHIEDVLFTGIIRERANVSVPALDFDNDLFCTHFNDETKEQKLKQRIELFETKYSNYIE